MVREAGLYSTQDEVYYVASDRGVYLVAGPDMRPKERHVEVESVPEGAVEVNAASVVDFADVIEESEAHTSR